MTPFTVHRSALLLLFVAFLFRLYFALAADFVFPDEPAHLQYIGHLLRVHALPTQIGPDDDRLLWESHQPPLYYLLGAGIVALLGPVPGFFALRLLSILLAGATGWLIYKSCQRLEIGPVGTHIALIFFAFLPTFIFTSSGINNDALLIFLCSLVFFLGLDDQRSPAVLGILSAAAVLAKLTGAVLIVYLAWRAVRLRRGLVAIFAPAIVFTIFAVRNIYLFGDVTALTATTPPDSMTPLNIARYFCVSFWAVGGYHFKMTFPVQIAFFMTFWIVIIAFARRVLDPLCGPIITALRDWWPAVLPFAFIFILQSLEASTRCQGRYAYLFLLPLAATIGALFDRLPRMAAIFSTVLIAYGTLVSSHIVAYGLHP